MRCPCCQQELPQPKLLVSVSTRTIAYGEQSVHVSPKVAEMAAILIRRMPVYVSFDSLIQQMWECDDEPDWSNKCLQVYGWTLRRALRPLGFFVETGDGYRVVPFDPAKHKSKDTRAKLDKSKADVIRRKYREGHTRQALARVYGVTQAAIRRVVEGVSYP